MLKLSYWENPPSRCPDKPSFLRRVISPNIPSESPIMDPHLLSAMVHDAGELRKHADLSQRKPAEEVGLYYATTITQSKAAKLRVQPDRYEAFAKALGGLLTRMSSSRSSRA